MNVVGLICGTSLDGIDAALVEVRFAHGRPAVALQAFRTVPLEAALRRALLAAMPPAALDARAFSALHAAVGEAFGDAARAVAGTVRVDLVGSHGITLAHDDAARHTVQIGDAFRIRERIGATVAFDFRAGDTAAGGNGAPLVPYVDALLLADSRSDRVALNLGGIANLTVLRAGASPDALVAFDSGPANLPLDTEVRRRTGAAFDRDGLLAAAGTPDAALLAVLRDDPYFQRPPPKSTGREQYGAAFSARWAHALDALRLEDALATLTALTASTVADAIRAHAPAGAQIVVSGGGARNPTLLAALHARLDGFTLEPSERFGIDVDAKEAIAFAILAVETLRGRCGNVPAVTGASGARVLGALAPHALDEVLARVRREETA